MPKSRFPVIDIHTHLSFAAKSENGVPTERRARRILAPPEELLPVMDRKNISMLVNLTGGMGQGLRGRVERYDKAHPGRFLTFTEPWWSRAAEPDYAKFQADELARAQHDGARGLKVLKTLGLYLREKVTTGPLVKVDDPRFDPMWEACGRAEDAGGHPRLRSRGVLPAHRPLQRALRGAEQPPGLVVPRQGFPEQPGNSGGPQPGVRAASEDAVHHAARGQRRREPGLRLGVHGPVSRTCSVEIGARIGELGRQPRTSRKFFDKYQDRILFGTDAVPHGDDTPQQVFNDELYEIYYRFLETEDEYFDYAPAPVPPQGRWRIYGIGLPEGILKKVYYDNAARLLGMAEI